MGNAGFNGGAVYNNEVATFLNCTIAYNAADQTVFSKLPKAPTPFSRVSKLSAI